MSNSTSPLCRVMISEPAPPPNAGVDPARAWSVDEVLRVTGVFAVPPPPPQAVSGSVSQTTRKSAMEDADRRGTKSSLLHRIHEIIEVRIAVRRTPHLVPAACDRR